MVDLIDRQAAIDEIDEWIKAFRENGHKESAADACLIQDGIIQLSSAQPEPQWIPVSEQLPEDEQEVLFSTKTGRVHLGRYHNDNSVNQWYSTLDKMRAWNNVVNAWMPLPEPYKDGEQDG